jgi:hypothetical protein
MAIAFFSKRELGPSDFLAKKGPNLLLNLLVNLLVKNLENRSARTAKNCVKIKETPQVNRQ